MATPEPPNQQPAQPSDTPQDQASNPPEDTVPPADTPPDVPPPPSPTDTSARLNPPTPPPNPLFTEFPAAPPPLNLPPAFPGQSTTPPGVAAQPYPQQPQQPHQSPVPHTGHQPYPGQQLQPEQQPHPGQQPHSGQQPQPGQQPVDMSGVTQSISPATVHAAGQPPAAPPQSPQPGQPPQMSATTSQPMWPVQQPPPQFRPTASYPAMQPVPPPYAQQQPQQQQQQQRRPKPRKPRAPGRGRDIATAVTLVVAAGLAVGGMFPNLDRAVDHNVNDDNSLGSVFSVTTTSPWYYRLEISSQPKVSPHLTQFFGVGISLGALLALVAAVFLLLRPVKNTYSVGAAALLFGAVLTTVLSAVNDLQWDKAETQTGRHTTLGLGFWLLVGAGVVAIVAVVLLLLTPKRVEPSTPRFGIPVVGQQPPGNPSSPNPAPQHVPGNLTS